jgi:MFS family permease
MAVLSAAIGYGVMSFIMTATPLQMHTMSGFSMQDTTLVIQSHIIAMFVPSLFTGFLIERLGLVRIMLAGLVSLASCVLLAIISVELLQYWSALILLGIGWNFLFVGGTILLSRSYRAAERFRAQAINDFTVFGLQALASLSAGTVLYYYSWAILNWINIPVLGLMLIFLLANRKTMQPLPKCP